MKAVLYLYTPGFPPRSGGHSQFLCNIYPSVRPACARSSLLSRLPRANSSTQSALSPHAAGPPEPLCTETPAMADRSEGFVPSRSAAAEKDEASSLAVHFFIFHFIFFHFSIFHCHHFFRFFLHFFVFFPFFNFSFFFSFFFHFSFFPFVPFFTFFHFFVFFFSPRLNPLIAPSRAEPAAEASHQEAAAETAAHHASEEDETAMEGARNVPVPPPSQWTAPELEAHRVAGGVGVVLGRRGCCYQAWCVCFSWGAWCVLILGGVVCLCCPWRGVVCVFSLRGGGGVCVFLGEWCVCCSWGKVFQRVFLHVACRSVRNSTESQVLCKDPRETPQCDGKWAVVAVSRPLLYALGPLSSPSSEHSAMLVAFA